MRSLVIAVALVACTKTPPAAPPTQHVTSFDDDLAFMRKHGDVRILQSSEGAVVAVSPDWQGRVMTSAVAKGERSLGFVHRKFIQGKERGTQFDNYGGEDRFWLGPEGTKFSLYFPQGAPMDFEHWQTPHAFNEGAWTVGKNDDHHLVMKTSLALANRAGTKFTIDVERQIDLVERADAAKILAFAVPNEVKMVAFASSNVIRNADDHAWVRDTGVPNVWILGMYAPSKDTFAIVPYVRKAQGPIVRDDYFGKVPADRLVQHDGWLELKCDGEHRSKIGVSPERAWTVLGSYSASARLLTIVKYMSPSEAKDRPSGLWKDDAEPYAGDAINAYNDGPVAPGKPSLGGFYELETTSPSAALSPGERLLHVQFTFHFVGDKDALSAISKRVLDVEL